MIEIGGGNDDIYINCNEAGKNGAFPPVITFALTESSLRIFPFMIILVSDTILESWWSGVLQTRSSRGTLPLLTTAAPTNVAAILRRTEKY